MYNEFKTLILPSLRSSSGRTGARSKDGYPWFNVLTMSGCISFLNCTEVVLLQESDA
jgi:hypothetical protein